MNKLAESSGSSQLNLAGAWAFRLPVPKLYEQRGSRLALRENVFLIIFKEKEASHSYGCTNEVKKVVGRHV